MTGIVPEILITQLKILMKKASQYGYAFVEVYPLIKKRKNNSSILPLILEEKKIYIDRINIRGNLKTVDV